MNERILTVTIPTPPRRLGQNGPQRNWRYKARLRKDQRQDAGIAALDAMNRAGLRKVVFAQCTIQPVWYRKNRRGQLDGDNANSMIKGAIDGLADAGVVANDRDVRLLPPRFEFGSDDPRVELVITDTLTGP